MLKNEIDNAIRYMQVALDLARNRNEIPEEANDDADTLLAMLEQATRRRDDGALMFVETSKIKEIQRRFQLSEAMKRRETILKIAAIGLDNFSRLRVNEYADIIEDFIGPDIDVNLVLADSYEMRNKVDRVVREREEGSNDDRN